LGKKVFREVWGPNVQLGGGGEGILRARSQKKRLFKQELIKCERLKGNGRGKKKRAAGSAAEYFS